MTVAPVYIRGQEVPRATALARGTVAHVPVHFDAAFWPPAAGGLVTHGADTIEIRDSTPPVGGGAGRIWVYRGANAGEWAQNMVKAVNGTADPAVVAGDAPTEAAVARYDAVADAAGFIFLNADAAGGNPVAGPSARAVASVVPGIEIPGAGYARGSNPSATARTRYVRLPITLDAAMIAAGSLTVVGEFDATDAWVRCVNNPTHYEPIALLTAYGRTVGRLALSGGAVPAFQDGDEIEVELWGA